MIVDTAERFDGRRIDRIGPMDLTVLATDCGSVPMNIGAVLKFDTAGGPSLAAVRALLSERVPTIPVSGCGAFRSAAAASVRLGNNTGVRPIAVPTLADDNARLAEIIALTRTNRELARASSAGPLGLAFRTLSRLRLFQTFIEHQRLVHTFETNMRCPTEPLCFGGHRVSAVVPAAVNPGNIGIAFDALSYAGVLSVTLVTDPDIVADESS